MQQGQHIGKIVLTMSEKSEDLPCAPSNFVPILRPDVSYLMVGGLGGLGRAVSTWMVEHGARNLVFLSRSAGDSPDVQAFLGELKAQGCHTQLVTGSVTKLSDLKLAIETAERPIAGVINMSMVLRVRRSSSLAVVLILKILGRHAI